MKARPPITLRDVVFRGPLDWYGEVVTSDSAEIEELLSAGAALGAVPVCFMAAKVPLDKARWYRGLAGVTKIEIGDRETWAQVVAAGRAYVWNRPSGAVAAPKEEE